MGKRKSNYIFAPEKQKTGRGGCLLTMLGMLLAQVQERFAVTLSFFDVMEDASVRALAQLVEQEQQDDGGSALAVLVNDMINE